jgi:hypothetical protein
MTPDFVVSSPIPSTLYLTGQNGTKQGLPLPSLWFSPNPQTALVPDWLQSSHLLSHDAWMLNIFTNHIISYSNVMPDSRWRGTQPLVGAMSRLQCRVCNVVSAMSRLQCRVCNVTSAMSRLQCHVCNVTSAMSRLQCHVCNVTSAMSRLQCRVCNVTSAMSHLQCHVGLEHYLWFNKWHFLRVQYHHRGSSFILL